MKKYSFRIRLIYLFKKRKITQLILYGIIFICSSSWMFFYFERIKNPQINDLLDSVWWLIVTLTTVGYGDIAPQTVEGRVIAIIAMLFGIGFISTLMANITSSLVTIRNKELKGMKTLYLKHHVIICGYHPRKLQNLLLELRWEKQFISLPVVLVSDSIHENPLPDEYKFSFIHGDIHNEEILIRAGIHNARYIIVLAESSNIHEDERTILTIMLAEQLNPTIYSIAELISSTKKSLLGKTNCNEIISSSDMSMNLIVKALQDPGSTKIVDELLTNTRGSMIYKASIPEDYTERNFFDLASESLQKNRIAIGIERKGKYTLNPKNDTLLESGDYYFYISSER